MNNPRSGAAGLPPMGPGGRPGGGRQGGPIGARVNREKPKNAKKSLIRLLKYIGKSKMLIVLLSVVMVAVTVTDLAGPALQGAAINTISVNPNGGLSVNLDAMIGYLSVKDTEGAEMTKSRLIDALLHLRRLSGVNISSIL